MIELLVISLTLIAISSILVIIVKNKKKHFPKMIYTQSSIHQIVKSFLPKDLFEVPKILSQSRKHVRDNSVKVLIMEDSAYWVHNNMFYVADTVDGAVDSETVRPVDTNNMSKRDIDKMLFILDSLKNGNSDDSSSTWNDRL
jgi:hypothetical protein